MDWPTLPQMFRAQARKYGGRAVLKVRRAGAYRDISWAELAAQVEETALGLLDFGVEPGDRVAILSENRPEWVAADLAVLSLGAVTVPIYPTLTPEEVEQILLHSGARVVFASNPELLSKFVHCQEALHLRGVLFDAPYRVAGPRVWWLGELRGLGRTAGPELRTLLEQRLQRMRPDDLASIIYTSGTTGIPKGVMLTHRNFLSNCAAVGPIFPIGEEDLTLSFLPLSHVFERMAGYYFILSVGATIAYAENIEAVPNNLLEVRPTMVIGVPRFYEKLHEGVQAAVRSSPPLRRRIFHWALRVGQERARRAMQGHPASGWLSLQHRLADRLVFSKLRARLGGSIRFCVSGGAPLPKSIGEFFYAAGILILEGYGLTETSPVVCANRPDRFRFGTVGPAIPGVEIRIAEDGEILTRGPHIMQGYYQNPQATAEVIDAEGWFHTGDVGGLSEDGFLTITDRKKDLLKTSGGKMVAPQHLEGLLKADPLIADCVVIGDRRKYVTALIVPNLEKVREFARFERMPAFDAQEMIRRPEVVDLLWQRVQAVNQRMATFEQVKKISLLAEPFAQGAGELTPTLKIKRRVVAERYAKEIEAMYLDAPLSGGTSR